MQGKSDVGQGAVGVHHRLVDREPAIAATMFVDQVSYLFGKGFRGVECLVTTVEIKEVRTRSRLANQGVKGRQER